MIDGKWWMGGLQRYENSAYGVYVSVIESSQVWIDEEDLPNPPNVPRPQGTP